MNKKTKLLTILIPVIVCLILFLCILFIENLWFIGLGILTLIPLCVGTILIIFLSYMIYKKEYVKKDLMILGWSFILVDVIIVGFLFTPYLISTFNDAVSYKAFLKPTFIFNALCHLSLIAMVIVQILFILNKIKNEMYARITIPLIAFLSIISPVLIVIFKNVLSTN